MNPSSPRIRTTSSHRQHRTFRSTYDVRGAGRNAKQVYAWQCTWPRSLCRVPNASRDTRLIYRTAGSKSSKSSARLQESEWHAHSEAAFGEENYQYTQGAETNNYYALQA